MSDNPFEPSGSAFGGTQFGIDTDTSQAESIRKSHLSHEANIQSFGCLYTFGGVMSFLAGIFYLGMGIFAASGGMPVPPPGPNAPAQNVDPATLGATMAIMGVFVLGIGVLQFLGGRAMQTLNPKGKIIAIIISAIGLLGFPCGTILSGYLLYLLLSAKGETVFSDSYKQVIQATPHIKYKTSIVVWILLFVLLGLIAAGIVAAVLNRN